MQGRMRFPFGSVESTLERNLPRGNRIGDERLLVRMLLAHSRAELANLAVLLLRHAQQLLLHLRREVRHANLCSGRITHSDGRWHRE